MFCDIPSGNHVKRVVIEWEYPPTAMYRSKSLLSADINQTLILVDTRRIPTKMPGRIERYARSATNI